MLGAAATASCGRCGIKHSTRRRQSGYKRSRGPHAGQPAARRSGGRRPGASWSSDRRRFKPRRIETADCSRGAAGRRSRRCGSHLLGEGHRRTDRSDPGGSRTAHHDRNRTGETGRGKARKAAAKFAMWLAASMLAGAVFAMLGATEGGLLRDSKWYEPGWRAAITRTH